MVCSASYEIPCSRSMHEWIRYVILIWLLLWSVRTSFIVYIHKHIHKYEYQQIATVINSFGSGEMR